MKEIRIYCLHPLCNNVDNALKYLQIDNLKSNFNFVLDDKNPDYLIATELIYTVTYYRALFNKLYERAKIVVFFTREAVTPDFNICDYAIGFDHGLSFADRFVRLPGPVQLYPAFVKQSKNEIDDLDKAAKELKQKTGFCNFLYSNPFAHPNRDLLFYAISNYKGVDSLGKHLNNVGNKAEGYKGHEDDSITLKRQYKFSIASENASFDGYTSEKIVTSLIAHTIPIYFGDKHIVENINPDCFVNCNNYNSLDEVVDAIKEIDGNDELWCRMISQPWQTQQQIDDSIIRVEKYQSFFCHIFSQDIHNASRRASGTFVNTYTTDVTRRNIYKPNLLKRLINKLSRVK